MSKEQGQHHGVRDLVISCIDYRFRARVAQWIKDTLGDQADLVAIAGASKAILDEASRATVLHQLEIAVKLHGIERVHILDHMDCGAYGGYTVHVGQEAETQFHAGQCGLAAGVIAAHFPQMIVASYIVNFDHVIAFAEQTVAERKPA